MHLRIYLFKAVNLEKQFRVKLGFGKTYLLAWINLDFFLKDFSCVEKLSNMNRTGYHNSFVLSTSTVLKEGFRKWLYINYTEPIETIGAIALTEKPSCEPF